MFKTWHSGLLKGAEVILCNDDISNFLKTDAEEVKVTENGFLREVELLRSHLVHQFHLGVVVSLLILGVEGDAFANAVDDITRLTIINDVLLDDLLTWDCFLIEIVFWNLFDISTASLDHLVAYLNEQCSHVIAGAIVFGHSVSHLERFDQILNNERHLAWFIAIQWLKYISNRSQVLQVILGLVGAFLDALLHLLPTEVHLGAVQLQNDEAAGDPWDLTHLRLHMVVTRHAGTPEDLFGLRACVFVFDAYLVGVNKEEFDLVAQRGNGLFDRLQQLWLVREEALDRLWVRIGRDAGEGVVLRHVELQLVLDDKTTLLQVVDEALAGAKEIAYLRIAEDVLVVLVF